MPLSCADVLLVANLCAQHHQRVRYGVLGAAIMIRAGRPAARAAGYGQATGRCMSTHFTAGTAASWVVGADGFPPLENFGHPPNPRYDPDWSVDAPLHDDVRQFLDWLDEVAPGWDENLASNFP
jgi:hypothetical protein